MDKYILGISAFYHDSAAALVKNNEIIAAAQEERFSRKKHDPRFPFNAINYCLSEAFIESDEIDMVVFYDHPLLTFDRLIKNFITAGDKGFEIFEEAMKSSMGVKWWVDDYVKKALGNIGKENKIFYCGHHMSHAASAFYPSPYNEAAILTVDGVGEWQTTTLGYGKDEQIKIYGEINYPHSLGLLYSAFTYYCGFKINSGEYKLMGLAPYGTPRYNDIIQKELIDIKPDGSYHLNMKYFGYIDSNRTINENFEQLFGGAARKPESRITQKEMDIAASIQKTTEDVMIKLAKHVKDLTGSENLCLAGGVALNCVANGKILKEKLFKNIWVQPASGDAGGSLGAALLAAYKHYGFKKDKKFSGLDLQKGSYLGPSFSQNEIEAFLNRHNYPFVKYETTQERNICLAKELNAGNILGYFDGRMEFGPRSLGARSILGDARNKNMQSVMNLKIKHRESFRPFAPAVLMEDVYQYFELQEASPYMLLVAPVIKRRRISLKESNRTDDMVSIINQVRSDIPAITHVDYSARVQTVHEETKPDFYDLIKAFKNLTGSSVIVNTSFNVRGEPIVCSPQDAYLCFMRTEIDILVLENYVLYKKDQPPLLNDGDWKLEYELD
ncbi:MAG TPA: carbamoyltransferase [Chitinophagaceae bacterium]|nr:carbamoyltransferase [Chitinophagaceae bacterium]